MSSQCIKLKKIVKKLETRKLHLLEDIYSLQKQHESIIKAKNDLVEPKRIEVFSRSQDKIIEKINLKGIKLLDINQSAKGNLSRQNKQKQRSRRMVKSQLSGLQKMNTTQDLMLSKNWQLKLIKKQHTYQSDKKPSTNRSLKKSKDKSSKSPRRSRSPTKLTKEELMEMYEQVKQERDE